VLHERSDIVSAILVRIPFDSAWHASVDGSPAPVFPADGVDLAVVVPAGSHTVELGYDDPRIAYGLIGSGVSLVLLLAGVVVARRRERRVAG
jgi:uncharacterized membrane protein YfhO